MAQFNEILEGGLNQALSRRLDMMGGAPAPVLAPEVIPTLQLPVAPEELWYYAGWRRWQAGLDQAAVAGQSARFRIRNAAGSGVLVVVEEIRLSTAAANIWRGVAENTVVADLTNNNSQDAMYLDGHQFGGDTAQLWLSVDTAAAVISGLGFALRTPADTPVLSPAVPLVLLPGNAWTFQTSSQNADAEFTVRYRARRLLQNEQLG